ncbi:MAG TPA: hypothetical protein VNK67_12640 [Burkholderiales bacterium]|nr:hypothetical protein [Burkholderiales bacterium]
MGVEIKLTDRELPVSPAMIEFLDARIAGRAQESSWWDQISEKLVPTEAERRLQYAQSVAERVIAHPLGGQAILRAYDLFTAVTIGLLAKLKALQERYRFICVVGCPRHGGSYLTRELFVAIGHDPARVPEAIAHDGFPDLAPFKLEERHNAHTAMTQQLAEYLAMVEVFFAGSYRDREGRTIVPKKATKAAYQGALVNAVLGPATEYIVTLRHPVAACVSTYEKSTGLPLDGRFDARGNIEEWVKRDLVWMGMEEGEVLRGDYFDIYLRYWEHYHYRLALSGLAASRNWTVVVYGRERMEALARRLHERFGSRAAPAEFKVFDRAPRHPEWQSKATAAIARVAQVWKSAGLAFPVEEVMEGW